MHVISASAKCEIYLKSPEGHMEIILTTLLEV